MTNQIKNWNNFYTNNTMAFPPEGLIRLIKGGPYPHLKMPKPQAGQLLLDVGFGDGSAFPLYQQAGLSAFGVEISEDIVAAASTRFVNNGINGNLTSGSCSNIPFENGVFDYLVSWNSCYYMSVGTGDFNDHVSEISRVLKTGGWLICSIPAPDCFIFDDIEQHSPGYIKIKSEYFGIRDGEVMRAFADEDDIDEAFSPYFTDFSHSFIHIDQFGIIYSWFVFTAMKR